MRRNFNEICSTVIVHLVPARGTRCRVDHNRILPLALTKDHFLTIPWRGGARVVVPTRDSGFAAVPLSLSLSLSVTITKSSVSQIRRAQGCAQVQSHPTIVIIGRWGNNLD